MASHSRHVEPVRQMAGLDQWVGRWIAVKDGEVVAAAANSRDLVPEVQKLGARGKGAVAQFVPPRSDAVVIGVG